MLVYSGCVVGTTSGSNMGSSWRHETSSNAMNKTVMWKNSVLLRMSKI